MSADRSATMGLQHLTVVPENFEPDADRQDDEASVDGDAPGGTGDPGDGA